MAGTIQQCTFALRVELNKAINIKDINLSRKSELVVFY